MYKEELRVVQYKTTLKVEKKKSKKKETKKVKKLGLFHLWGREEDKKGKEVFFALVEDLESGDVVEVSAKNLRFLSDDEIEAITTEALLEDEVEEEIEELDENSGDDDSDDNGEANSEESEKEAEEDREEK